MTKKNQKTEKTKNPRKQKKKLDNKGEASYQHDIFFTFQQLADNMYVTRTLVLNYKKETKTEW